MEEAEGIGHPSTPSFKLRQFAVNRSETLHGCSQYIAQHTLEFSDGSGTFSKFRNSQQSFQLSLLTGFIDVFMAALLVKKLGIYSSH